ncbi:hypothetical protein P4B35_16225 [Pontiellaceae bacterium B12227]|nr:hypothetical protein [Pontiellaceae bacterium B12227]
MKSKTPKLSLIDMDVGLFVSYELTAEALSTKLFRFITLNRIPLNKVMELREAEDQDVTQLNRINWFRLRRKQNRLTPLYTFQAAQNRPRIFMRLDYGSHVVMKETIGDMHHG